MEVWIFDDLYIVFFGVLCWICYVGFSWICNCGEEVFFVLLEVQNGVYSMCIILYVCMYDCIYMIYFLFFFEVF